MAQRCCALCRQWHREAGRQVLPRAAYVWYRRCHRVVTPPVFVLPLLFARPFAFAANPPRSALRPRHARPQGGRNGGSRLVLRRGNRVFSVCAVEEAGAGAARAVASALEVLDIFLPVPVRYHPIAYGREH